MPETRVKIGFSTTNKWFSRLIRYWTNSEVSHSFAVYHDPNLDRQIVLDVDFTGYRMVPYDAFCRENKVLYLFEPDIDLMPGVRVVSRWIGRKYDWRALVAFWRVLKGLRRTVTEMEVGPKELICTECIVHLLRVSCYPGAADLDPKGTSPQMLLDFMRNTCSAALSLKGSP